MESDFCVINDATDLYNRLLGLIAHPVDADMACWLEDFEDVLEAAEDGAREMQVEVDNAESETANAQDELDTARSEADDWEEKHDEAVCDYVEANEERRVLELQLERRADWRMTDDPFKQWYKENVHVN